MIDILIFCLQIAECRRVLQWSYAYGYRFDEEEDRKTKLFNFLQCIQGFLDLNLNCISVTRLTMLVIMAGEAESALERLHHCAEIELMTYVDGDTVSPYEFLEFGDNLVNLTR